MAYIIQLVYSTFGIMSMGIIMKTINDKKAEIFKALANPVRLDVIDQLLDGE